jgi:hypothetical protein
MRAVLLATLQRHSRCSYCLHIHREAKIGPGQLGLAAGAVLFGLVFLIVSSGDFATTNRYKVGPRRAAQCCK